MNYYSLPQMCVCVCVVIDGNKYDGNPFDTVPLLNFSKGTSLFQDNAGW